MGRYYERTKRAGKHIRSAGPSLGKIVVGISLIFAMLSLGGGVRELKVGMENQVAAKVPEGITLIFGIGGAGLLLWGVLGFIKKYQVIGVTEREGGLKVRYLWEMAGAGFVAGIAGIVLGVFISYVIGRLTGVVLVYRGDYIVSMILLALTGGVIVGGYMDDGRE